MALAPLHRAKHRKTEPKSFDPQDCREIPDIARAIPEITECCRITGEDCYFMKLFLRSIDDLEPILNRFSAHGRTTTSIVHGASVEVRELPMEA